MKGQFKKRHQQEEWMKRVDISVLFQLDEEAKNLQRHAKKTTERALQKIADRFTYLLAVANGRVEIPSLTGEKIKAPESVS